MVRAGTIVFFVASAVLFFVVRQFLIRWGLVDRRKTPRDGQVMRKGDMGLQRFFAWGAYFFLWVLPSWIGWSVLAICRELGWMR